MYVTNGRTDGQKQRLMPPSLRVGHKNQHGEFDSVTKQSSEYNVALDDFIFS